MASTPNFNVSSIAIPVSADKTTITVRWGISGQCTYNGTAPGADQAVITWKRNNSVVITDQTLIDALAAWGTGGWVFPSHRAYCAALDTAMQGAPAGQGFQ